MSLTHSLDSPDVLGCEELRVIFYLKIAVDRAIDKRLKGGTYGGG